MTADERGLLDAIFAAPNDDLPRLVYADWLDEHRGDAGAARAEFIRLQCELARLDESDPRTDVLRDRCYELRDRHCSGWAPGAEGAPTHYFRSGQFTRGFVDEHHVGDADLGSPGLDRLLRSHPVTDITVGTMPEGYDGGHDPARPSRLPDWPHLSRVRRLSFCWSCHQHPDEVGRLLASPLLTSLRELNAEFSPFGDGHAGIVADSPRFRSLRTLELGRSPLTSLGVSRLLRSTILDDLTSVTLSGGNPNPSGGGFGPEVLRDLTAAGFLPALTRLTLRWFGQTGATVLDSRAAVLGLLADPRLGPLRELKLWSNPVGDGLADVLGTASFASHLRTLSVQDSGVTAVGAARLVRHPSLAGLTELWLDENPCGGGWFRVLGRTTWPGLRFLNLGRCGVTGADIERLGRTFPLQSLRSLMLDGNPIGDRGAIALAASAYAGRLDLVLLSNCDIGPAGAAALARSPLGGRIRWLHLSDNPVMADWPDDVRIEYSSRPITDWPPGRRPR